MITLGNRSICDNEDEFFTELRDYLKNYKVFKYEIGIKVVKVVLVHKKGLNTIELNIGYFRNLEEFLRLQIDMERNS